MSPVAKVFGFDILAKAVLAVIGFALIRLMPSAEYAHYTFAVSLIAIGSEALVNSWRTIYVAGERRFGSRSGLGVFVNAQVLIIALAIIVIVPLSAASNGLFWIMALVVVGRGLSELGRGAHLKALNFLVFAGVELLRVLILCGTVLTLSMLTTDVRAWQVLGLEAIGLLSVGMILLIQQRAAFGAFSLRAAVELLRNVATSQYGFFWAYLIAVGVFGQLDTLMLRLISDEHSLAAFGSSLRYYGVLSMLLAAVNLVFLPMAVRVQTVDDANKMMAGHRRLVIGFSAIVGVAIAAAGWAIPLVDQGRYPEAVLSFRILAASSVLSLAFSPYVNLLIRLEDFQFMLRLVGTAILLDLGLNMLLIPRFGAPGAAMTTTLASAVINVGVFLRWSVRAREVVAEYRGVAGPEHFLER